MKNQASLIRKLTIELLKDHDKLTMISDDVYGIRYTDLKDFLLDHGKYNFTVGAVTSALNTLPDRVENIHKMKIDRGTFFYYGVAEIDQKRKEDGSIVDSNSFEEINNLVIKTERSVQEVLYRASQGDFVGVTNTDIKYLKEILAMSGQLNRTLKEYKNEKYFSNIIRDDQLPF